MTMAMTNPVRSIVLVVAVRDDSASLSVGPNRQVAPVFDWRSRRAKTGATMGCGIGRDRKYAG
jgi:hypothetical protein